MERIRRIRNAGKGHAFTLVCRDLSEISTYASCRQRGVSTAAITHPGSVHVHSQSDARGAEALAGSVAAHDRHPCSGSPRGAESAPGARRSDHELDTHTARATTLPLSDPHEIRARLEDQVEAVLDSGSCGLVPTTVVDLVGEAPRVIRAGKGAIAGLEVVR